MGKFEIDIKIHGVLGSEFQEKALKDSVEIYLNEIQKFYLTTHKKNLINVDIKWKKNSWLKI